VLPKLSTNDFQSRCIGARDGSRTFLQQVVLKPHEQAANVFIQSSGATVKAVTASQVEYMLLNHSNEKVRPQTFRMKPYSFVANLPLVGNHTTTNKRVKKVTGGDEGDSVASGNNATTGHKSRQQR
jgi:hypothetical protein